MEDELGNMTLKLINLSLNQDHLIMEEAGASSRLQLHKISIPTFDGKVLNWKSFWEQSDDTIHNKVGLNDTNKLTYLQDALKDNPGRFVIEGLT